MALVFTYSITASSIYVHSSETQLSKHKENEGESHLHFPKDAPLSSQRVL